MKQPKISEATRAILALADVIPGLGQDQFLIELAEKFGTQRYLTQAQVADMLNVSPQTVLYWRKDGLISPSMIVRGKFGCTGSVRFSLKDISDFIKRQRKETTKSKNEGIEIKDDDDEI